MRIEITQLLKKYTVQTVLAIAVIAGLIMASVPTAKVNSGGNPENTGIDLYTYTDNLEKRLENIIREINGAGSTTVMLTLESSFESVYANNARLEENPADVNGSAKTTEKQIVLAGGSGNAEEPVLLKELCPKVKGVFVVCEGGGDRNVAQNIKSAVSALFGVSETKVCVTAGTGRSN